MSNIGYIKYRTVFRGQAYGISFLFDDKAYQIIGAFLSTDGTSFSNEIDSIMDMYAKEESEYSFTGNIYRISISHEKVFLSDVVDDDAKNSCVLDFSEFADILKDWKTTKAAFKREEYNLEITPTSKVVDGIQKNILDGRKIPHSVSMPVLYSDEGKYYLAVFAFFFTKEDIQSEMINRPELWAVLDLKTGEIIKRYQCKDHDFSNASFEEHISIRPDGDYDLSKNYYHALWSILDSVRYDLLCGDELNQSLYDYYIKGVLRNIPKGYQRFYLDLSV